MNRKLLAFLFVAGLFLPATAYADGPVPAPPVEKSMVMYYEVATTQIPGPLLAEKKAAATLGKTCLAGTAEPQPFRMEKTIPELLAAIPKEYDAKVQGFQLQRNGKNAELRVVVSAKKDFSLRVEIESDCATNTLGTFRAQAIAVKKPAVESVLRALLLDRHRPGSVGFKKHDVAANGPGTWDLDGDLLYPKNEQVAIPTATINRIATVTP